MKKQYYVKNRFRFTIFLGLIFALTFFTVGTAFGLDTVQGIPKIPGAVVIVEQGDTLWQIAGNVKPKGYDTRKAIYEICQVNEMKNSEIMPGQKLVIPYHI